MLWCICTNDLCDIWTYVLGHYNEINMATCHILLGGNIIFSKILWNFEEIKNVVIFQIYLEFTGFLIINVLQ